MGCDLKKSSLVSGVRPHVNTPYIVIDLDRKPHFEISRAFALSKEIPSQIKKRGARVILGWEG